MKFEYEKMPNLNTVVMYIERCEGKHIQQVVYSTYHKALTQICFGCKKIRTTIEIEEDTKADKSVPKIIFTKQAKEDAKRIIAQSKKGCGKKVYGGCPNLRICVESGFLCDECLVQSKDAPAFKQVEGISYPNNEEQIKKEIDKDYDGN